jgi:hypothetical protein
VSTYQETRVQLGRQAYGRLAAAAAELQLKPHTLGLLLLEGALAQLERPSDDLAAAIREAAAQLQTAGQA